MYQVCNDVRSDIESSSEEETDTPTEGLRSPHSPKGENGTNGHCAAAKGPAQNHSSWWHARRTWEPPAVLRSRLHGLRSPFDIPLLCKAHAHTLHWQWARADLYVGELKTEMQTLTSALRSPVKTCTTTRRRICKWWIMWKVAEASDLHSLVFQALGFILPVDVCVHYQF